MPKGKVLPMVGPESMHQWFTGIEVPDPITFFTHPDYCDRPIYPRQGTLLKVIFLREDLFTEFDYDVVAEWEEDFRNTGNNGICPQILERMRYLKSKGYKWFREVLLVMGRRAGKGYISGLSLAYVLWNYMALGDPQGHYGVDRDKRLTCLIFAGKRDQAKATVFGDLRNVITGAPCFAPYISQVLAERLSVYAPHDFVRIRKMAERGVQGEMDMATFEILPKESTMMAGRGPASFSQAYDEMAHVVASGANRSAEEVYCLDPETKVLCADLIWRPIKDLGIGDEVVAFDEHVKPGEGQRKLRRAVVEGVRWSRSAPVKLVFEDGTSVVCSENHRWFSVGADCNSGKWKFAGRPPRRVGSAGRLAASLQVGDHIRFIADPWETDDTRDGGWLAGIFDGEGWVGSPGTTAFRVGVSQNPGLGAGRDRASVEAVRLRLLRGAASRQRQEPLRLHPDWGPGSMPASARSVSTDPVALQERGPVGEQDPSWSAEDKEDRCHRPPARAGSRGHPDE